MSRLHSWGLPGPFSGYLWRTKSGRLRHLIEWGSAFLALAVASQLDIRLFMWDLLYCNNVVVCLRRCHRTSLEPATRSHLCNHDRSARTNWASFSRKKADNVLNVRTKVSMCTCEQIASNNCGNRVVLNQQRLKTDGILIVREQAREYLPHRLSSSVEYW